MTSTPVQGGVKVRAMHHETPSPQPDPPPPPVAAVSTPLELTAPPNRRLLRQILRQAALCRRRLHRTIISGETGLQYAEVIKASRYIEQLTVPLTLEEAVELLQRAFRRELPHDLLTEAERRRRFQMDTCTGPAPAAAFASLWLTCCLNEVTAALDEVYRGNPARAEAFLDGPYRLRRFGRARSALPDLSG